MRHSLLLVLALPLVLPFVIGDRPTSAVTTLQRTNGQRSYPIEQESPDWFFGPKTHPETWVSYPPDFNCAWDVDDYDQFYYGNQTVAAETTASLCVVADGYDNYGGDNHSILIHVASPKPNLAVWLENSQGLRWDLHGVTSRGATDYRLCVIDLTGYPNPPNWYPVIAGSNGGTGIPVTYTLHVFPLDHTARRVLIDYGSLGTFGAC